MASRVINEGCSAMKVKTSNSVKEMGFKNKFSAGTMNINLHQAVKERDELKKENQKLVSKVEF